MNDDEIVQIPGRWDNYGITRDGRVYNLVTGNQVSTYVANTGYLCVRLWKDGKTSIIPIHRLLAIVYLPIFGYEVEKLDVNHINGIKLDIRLENLEWCSRKQNCDHAYSTGLRSDNKHIVAVNADTGEIESFYSMGEAGRFFGVTAAAIHWQLNNQPPSKVYKGYRLRYDT